MQSIRYDTVNKKSLEYRECVLLLGGVLHWLGDRLGTRLSYNRGTDGQRTRDGISLVNTTYCTAGPLSASLSRQLQMRGY